MCTEIWTQYGRLKVCPKQTKLRWLMRQVAPQHLRGQYHYDTCTSGSNKQTQKQQVNKTKQRNCAWNEKTNNIFALPWITSSYHSCKHSSATLVKMCAGTKDHGRKMVYGRGRCPALD